MAPHSSTLAWKIPWMEEPGRLQLMGSLSGTQLNDFTFTFHFHALEKGNGNPLQCAYLENPRDWGASWAAVYGVTQNQTRLKRLSSSRVHKASELLLRVTPSYFSSSNSDYRVVYECVSHLVMSDPLWPHGLYSPSGSSVHGILQERILE